MKLTSDSKELLYGCFCGVRGYELAMTRDQAESCSHAGECYDDCRALCARDEITAQFADYDRSDLEDALRETGGWSRAELAEMSDMDLRIKCVWIAACDIRENQ